MAQLFCSGPALIYVGIPVTWTQVLQAIYQTQQITITGQTTPPSPSPSPGSPNFVGPNLPTAQIQNNIQRDAVLQTITDTIERLLTAYVPVFLGTTEGEPTAEIIPGWDVVETDAGGTENPSERLSNGEEAIIRCDMTRYNEAVYEAIAARSQTNAFLGRFPGFGQVGKAMALEKLAFPLWLVFPYAGKTVFGAAGQPPGYRFFQSFLEGPDRLENLGTTNRLVGLQFRAQRLLKLTGNTSNLNDGGMLQYSDVPFTPIVPHGFSLTTDVDDSIGGLYDFSVSGLPSPN